jgi:hypothetical protein
MPDPTVHSQVPKVEVKNDDDNIVLTVQVVGFAEGKSVEISGYVTQNSGAYASFRETREIPKANSEGAAELEVTVPWEKLKLAEEPVTVVTWVSEVWPSILKVGTPAGGFKAAWEIDPAATDLWRSNKA